MYILGLFTEANFGKINYVTSILNWYAAKTLVELGIKKIIFGQIYYLPYYIIISGDKSLIYFNIK